MDDHHAFFNSYGIPTLDDIFTATEPKELSDLPAIDSDFDLSGDFRSVWLSVGEAGRSTDQPLQVSPVSINCEFCQILRTIVHVHYGFNHYMKLEIHGGLGVISHAVLEKRITDSHSQFETLDFSNKSAEEIRQILGQYCWERSEEGYIMSNDSLSLFYEALCAGQILQKPDFVNIVRPQPQPQPQPEQEHYHIDQVQEQELEQRVNNQLGNRRRRARNNPHRIPLSEQRKRTARMTLKDLSAFFHFALADAAKSLEVCSTVLKKICRRDGITRWPYRKIDSVKKKIEALQQNLNSRHAAVRAEAQEKIIKLRQEAASACGGFNIL